MARLTTKGRKALPASDFAGPGRSYLDENASHARDALSRVSANGSPAVKQEVREKVEKKYPGMVHKDGPSKGREKGAPATVPGSHDAFMGMTHGDKYDHSMSRKR